MLTLRSALKGVKEIFSIWAASYKSYWMVEFALLDSKMMLARMEYKFKVNTNKIKRMKKKISKLKKDLNEGNYS